MLSTLTGIFTLMTWRFSFGMATVLCYYDSPRVDDVRRTDMEEEAVVWLHLPKVFCVPSDKRMGRAGTKI